MDVLWRLHLVNFSMWHKVKSYGNERIANEHRFRPLAVSSHGSNFVLKVGKKQFIVVTRVGTTCTSWTNIFSFSRRMELAKPKTENKSTLTRLIFREINFRVGLFSWMPKSKFFAWIYFCR